MRRARKLEDAEILTLRLNCSTMPVETSAPTENDEKLTIGAQTFLFLQS
jgi:hypothetical protein